MRARRFGRRLRQHFVMGPLVLTLGACASLQSADSSSQAEGAAGFQVAKASQTANQSPSVSNLLQPAPEIFEAKGRAVWDGKRTLQGIWVAHPLAGTARRVRIYNTNNDFAVDGALFKSAAAARSTNVLISSEAAQQLGMDVGKPVDLRIVAVKPADASPAVAEAPAASDPEPEVAKAPAASEKAPAKATEPAGSDKAPAVAKAPAASDEAPVAATAPVEPGPAPAAAPTPVPSARAPAEPEKPAAAPTETAVAAVQPKAETAKPVAAPKADKPSKTETATKPKTDEAVKPDRTFAWEKPPQDEAVAQAKTQPKAKAAVKAKPKAKKKKRPLLAVPYVQAGVFGVSGNAKRLVRRLRGRGIPAIRRNVTAADGRKLTRVLAGPFRSTKARSRAQRTLRSMGMSDARPVRR